MEPEPVANAGPPAIEMIALEKRFGEVRALAGLDLRVDQGDFFGLLGPNGAGKTTAVEVLATLTRPSGGAARVLGLDVVAQARRVRPHLGLVFQEPTLDPELTAREHLELQARLYHLGQRSSRVADALAWVDLAADAERPARGLSGGMKRRLEIARGLLHRPRVLFLDEPTQGLDPNARAAVWSKLRELRRSRGTTIFLTTHSMEEADALCERVAILDRGRLVADGPPDALKAALGGDQVALVLEREPERAALAALPGVRSVASEPCAEGVRVRITLAEGPRRLAGLLDGLRDRGVREVRLARPTLEDVFRHHTGHPFEPEAEARA
jgi:ABC-2 type transport system ATP-binding protein